MVGPGMLSRIAESLFWIGRYVERADDTARILDVHLHLMLEDLVVNEDAASRSLLSVMGVSAPGRTVDVRQVLELLAYDMSAPTAIAGALGAARENARGARETISSEMWEALNTTWIALPERRRRASRHGAHAYFSWVRERAALINGISDATMSRDDGWRFLMLGRSIERVDMTTRLVLTRALAGGGAASWTVLLRSCGAFESYLRAYRGSVSDESAAEFLILDRLFPRSIYHALSMAERCLDELDDGWRRTGTDDVARRVLGRARTALEFRGADEVSADLAGEMESIQRACSLATEALSARYFPDSAMSWAREAQ